MNILRVIQFIGEARETLDVKRNVSMVKSILAEPSLYQKFERKDYNTRKRELWKWYFHNKEVCRYYNSYGFDIKDFRNQEDYISYKQFRIERDRDNYQSISQIRLNNKISILRDKVLFSAYFGTLLGKKYVVPSIGKILPDGGVFAFRTHTIENLSSFIKSYSGNFFVKKINGECGEGCYIVNSDTDCDEFLNRIKGSVYLIQNQIQQHEEINKINSKSLNTIRIITIIGSNSFEPSIFAHYMRFGTGNAFVDNRAVGGLGVAISDEGKLVGSGIGHHSMSATHPDTGVVFEGRVVPFWDEVKSLVVRAHQLVPEIKTIGWDVAITPDGPVLVEGNDNWEISGPQDIFGGLKEKWYAMRER